LKSVSTVKDFEERNLTKIERRRRLFRKKTGGKANGKHGDTGAAPWLLTKEKGTPREREKEKVKCEKGAQDNARINTFPKSGGRVCWGKYKKGFLNGSSPFSCLEKKIRGCKLPGVPGRGTRIVGKGSRKLISIGSLVGLVGVRKERWEWKKGREKDLWYSQEGEI